MKKMFNHIEMGTFRHLMFLKHHNSPYVFFILRLKLYGKIGQEEVDIENAKIYNIPNCCRDFYILLTKFGHRPTEFMNYHFGRDKKSIKLGYVRCPICRRINLSEFRKNLIKEVINHEKNL